MKLLWLDLETTGLNPARGKILEVATAVADLETPFDLGPFYSCVLPLPPDGDWDGEMDEYVRDMHTKNGLLRECRDVWGACDAAGASASTFLRDVEIDLISRLPDPIGEKREDRTVLAGSTISFDHEWLKVHMPTLAERLSHRHYDVSAVKLFCQSLGMPKLPKVEAHRAQADVRESVAHAQSCALWLARNDHWVERD